MNDLNLQWSVWNGIHEEVDQVKRQKSSASSKLTPLSLSSDSGVFKGSSKDYLTTLTTCECRDFFVRHKPCKHMYRLANELHVLSDSVAVETDVNIAKKFRIEEAMDIISTFTDSDKTFIHNILDSLLRREFILIQNDELACKLISNSFLVECDKKYEFASNYLDWNYKKSELIEKFNLVSLPKSLNKKALIETALERFPSIMDGIFDGNILVSASVAIQDIIPKIVYRLERFSHDAMLTETISCDEHKLLADFRKLDDLQKAEIRSQIYMYLNS